ncbi:MAG: hypothetical protein ABIH50_06390 [bacterium]
MAEALTTHPNSKIQQENWLIMVVKELEFDGVEMGICVAALSERLFPGDIDEQLEYAEKAGGYIYGRITNNRVPKPEVSSYLSGVMSVLGERKSLHELNRIINENGPDVENIIGAIIKHLQDSGPLVEYQSQFAMVVALNLHNDDRPRRQDIIAYMASSLFAEPPGQREFIRRVNMLISERENAN